MVKRGLSASNGFWNTSCALRRNALSCAPCTVARSKPSIGDAAGGRRFELEQQPPGRGLAAAGLAEQADAVVLVEREVDAVDRMHGGPAARAAHRRASARTGKCLARPVTSTRAAMWRPPWRGREGCGFGGAPAGGAVIGGDLGERRIVAAAARDRERAARREAAAGRRRAQVGRRAGDRHDLRRRRGRDRETRWSAPSCRDGTAAPAPRRPARTRPPGRHTSRRRGRTHRRPR